MALNESSVFVANSGKKIDMDADIPICIETDFKDALLANLYATVEFLRKELEEKYFFIRALLDREKISQTNIKHAEGDQLSSTTNIPLADTV